MEPVSPGPVRWRIKRSLRGRRGHIANELINAAIMMLFCVGGVGLGVLMIVLFWPPGPGDVAGALVWMVPSGLLILVVVDELRKPVRELRRREDRVWLDEADLWWIRHRPASPGAEPHRVSRSEIVEVRLAGDDARVVVKTVDRTEHVLTDLGALSDRVALANEIGERIGPGTGRVHPKSPPELPHGWQAQAGPDKGTTVLWRRPNRARPWSVLVLGYGWCVLAIPFVVYRVPEGSRFAPAAVVVLGVAGVIWWFVYEFRFTRIGWLARVGRLDAVRIRARSGDPAAGPANRPPRRVVRLVLERGRWWGRRRLRVEFDSGESHVVTRGWDRRRIGALAGWLADRADLPLTTSGGRPTVTTWAH